jgi:stress response protein YsnF
MTKSVIAVYKDDSFAHEAIRDLHQHGFDPKQILLEEWPAKTPDRILEDLEERNVPHERAELYAEAVRRGAALVMADTADEASGEVAQVLDAHAPLDLDRTAERWRTEGWQGLEAGAGPYAQPERDREHQHLAQESFDVVEEEMKVGQREVGQSIRIRSLVTERPVTEQVQLRKEHIEVTREPGGSTVSPQAAEEVFREGEVVVTATSEEPVVETEARVVEQVHVSKDAETRTEEISGTERRRDIVVEPVEREGANGKPDGDPTPRTKR